MKKFLTVLLVIAVMFTFSFSSAMAYSWDQGTFGLADAQAEATTYVNAYDISAFTGAMYYTVQAAKSTAVADIADGTTVASVTSAVATFENFVKTAKASNTSLADAKTNAGKQLLEFKALLNDVINLSTVNSTVEGTIDNIYTSATDAVAKATTEGAVEKALEDAFSAIKDEVLDLAETYDFDKSQLLNASLYVRTYADKVWKAYGNDASHTDLVKSEYTALVNAAVSEAKAINSYAALEAFKVKYGLDPTTGDTFASNTEASVTSFDATVKGNIFHNAGVYKDTAKKDLVVYRSGYSVLAEKAMETKLAAVVKEVAKAALAELGAYDATAINGDYSFATEAQLYVKNWTSASDFYDELNDAADYGTINTGSQLAKALTDAHETISGDALASDKADYVDAFVNAYAQFTKVNAAKATASATVAEYNVEGVYSTANKKAVESYVKAFAKELGNAKTVADVEALEAKYDAILDDIETLLEATQTNTIKKFNATVDEAVSLVKKEYKGTMTNTYGVDEEGAIDALAARLKEIAKDFVEAGTEPASFTNVTNFTSDSNLNAIFGTDTDVATLSNLLKGIAGNFENAKASFATAMNFVYALPSADALGYDNDGDLEYSAINNTALENSAFTTIVTNNTIVSQIVANWNGSLNDYNWSTVPAMRKSQLDQIAAYAKTYTVYYPVLVERADAAVAKLATPEKSAAFVKLLDEALTAIEAVDACYNAADDAGFDVSAISEYDRTAYKAAVEAYAKLVYEAKEGTGSDTDAWVDFEAIEAKVTGTGEFANDLSSADQSAAATICAQAWAAKAAAKTDAAVNDAAETAIAALDALTLDADKIAASNAVTADALAAMLAKAQSYFAYYEKANFTSAATTKLGLAKDVVSFYNFALDEEEAKAYVQDLAITARSAKTAKGNIKVTINANVAPLKEAGYTVEYKFYRSTKARSGYKLMITKKTNTYTNTSGTKGVKYFYKAKLVVKDANGAVVATTPLTQCKYACRVK